MRFDNANFRSLNAAIVKMQSEDFQTPERDTQMTKALIRLGGEHSGTSPAIKKQQKKQASTYSRDRMERQSDKVYGKDGKVVKKKVAESVESAEYTELLESVLLALCEELELDPNELLEDYQTRERDRQMANTGQLGSSLDAKEKASMKVYGKDGVVAHKSLRSMGKKANWKALENEKNRLAQRFADPNKTSSFEDR